MRQIWFRRASSVFASTRHNDCFKFRLTESNLPLYSTRFFHAPSVLLEADVVPLRKQLKDAAKIARNEKFQGNNADSELVQNGLDDWELTVGIEIHAQLNTSQKLFSDAPTYNTEEPNINISPFDLALPGSQPVFQIATLIPALRAAIALNCEIQPTSRFDRKHYFYHDQPSGYQITQYYQPFAKDGHLILNSADGLPEGEETYIGIKQVQMEQDTARTQEQDSETNLIDFNRSGHPLIEIISLPHIHTPQVASAYVRKIQGVLQSIDAVTTGMELGGLRADVNVSVRRKNEIGGSSYGDVYGLGQRTEIKNLSTFKGVEDAIRAERDRQIAVLEAGGRIEGETRGWSVTNPGVTRRLRGKEGEVDYRYMPDPDIAPLHISNEVMSHLTETLPPVPEELTAMLMDYYGMSLLDAKTLISVDDGQRLDYFQDVVDHIPSVRNSSRFRNQSEVSASNVHSSRSAQKTTTTEASADLDDEADNLSNQTKSVGQTDMQQLGKTVGNWVLHELGSLLSTSKLPWNANRVPSNSLATIIALNLDNKITGHSAKKLLKLIFEGYEGTVFEIAKREKLLFTPMTDPEYQNLASKIISEYPQHVQDIRDKGKVGMLNFLVGQMMRAGQQGRMNPKKVGSVLRKRILGNRA